MADDDQREQDGVREAPVDLEDGSCQLVVF